MYPSYRKWACYWYNPKYYESGTYDVDIITYRFEIIRTLKQRGTCKETTRKAFKGSITKIKLFFNDWYAHAELKHISCLHVNLSILTINILVQYQNIRFI